MRKIVISVIAVALSSTYGYVTCIHVDPVKASWSGWTRTIPGYDNVAQTVTCNFDSLSYIELFAGAKGNGGPYTATVYDGGVRLMRSNGSQTQNESWVRFDNWFPTGVAFTKAKQLTITFTRGGSDSIQYYTRADDPYKYDLIAAGGSQLSPGPQQMA